MSTDRELLELAAEAAGKDLTGSDWGGGRDGFYWVIEDQPGRVEYWNPLADDGDALRLAVKLRLCLFLEIPRIGIGPMVDGPEIYVEDGEDTYAATRRAIVRAAAEIGKSK